MKKLTTIFLLIFVCFTFNSCHSANIYYKVGTITYENNMTVVNIDDSIYYDISTYGLEAGLYSEADYNRLKNVQIDINNCFDENSVTVYYNKKPFFKHILNEQLVIKNFFGNSVCFITSTDDAKLLVKKQIVLPELKAENIEKIVIISKDDEDILFDNETEISKVLGNPEMISNNSGYQECQVYYNNTDANIYEIINNDTLEYLN